MAGLIPDDQKASLGADFHAAMATFFVPIIIYSAPELVVITEDPAFNRFNSFDQNNLTPDNEPIRHVVSGRIQYGSKMSTESEPYNKVTLPVGEVRIKIDASGAALMSAAKQIELNGEMFNIDTTPRRHGLFSGDYTTFYLKKA